MRKIYSTLCFLALFFISHAQNSGFHVTGQVIDTLNGAPISGASIELSPFGTEITDEEGHFQFQFRLTRPGTYTLKVTNVGYKPYETSITLPANTPVNIPLSRVNLFMAPVEVHALRAGEKAPFTKTNIGKRQIEATNLGQDLPFLLNQTPSVTVNSDAGNGIGYTGIHIRGTDATRINMTLNGIPYNDAESY